VAKWLEWDLRAIGRRWQSGSKAIPWRLQSVFNAIELRFKSEGRLKIGTQSCSNRFEIAGNTLMKGLLGNTYLNTEQTNIFNLYLLLSGLRDIQSRTCAIVVWSLYCRCAIDSQLLCYRCAIGARLLRYHYANDSRLLCSQCAISLRDRCTIAVLSMRYRFSIDSQSLCYHCIIAALLVRNRCSIDSQLLSYRFAIDSRLIRDRLSIVP
jgi:hypothetical protein